MEKNLYDMMHWGRIEAVVYAEEDKPYDFLGAHRNENGTLIQAYFPDASGVSVLYRGKEYPMECADESGFFAEQVYGGHCHWLPWCTFVEVDPVSRLYDTFGVYEIADAEKLPLEERLERNRRYAKYV